MPLLPAAVRMTAWKPCRQDSERASSASVSGDWGLDTARRTYLPVGFDSYHWALRASDGRRFFLSVDDLDRKPWLGADRTSAFATASMLQRQAGLRFMVAPVPTLAGDLLRRITPQYSLAVFPFHEGRSDNYGEPLTPEDRRSA